ncbi:MAG: MFS transporter, partial [Prevotellaceae bacterium]|nr:MFS transporter [Prevotellaceae bacterium]
MWKFLNPPAFKPEKSGAEANAEYKRLRWQVFLGIFIGYAGFYIVRKNFSMAIPMLADLGFDKGELGIVLSMNAIAYGFSKFIMASVSDRSNARRFLPLGLTLAALSMMFMIVPVQLIGREHKDLAIALMAFLNFLVGWFNGMGWPPCGRVMTHWFSIKERGTWMSVWNCAHNVGGALVGPMSVYGAVWFGSWFYGADTQRYFLIGTYLFPACVAILIAIVAYCLIRDTPQSCGLPSIEKWRNDYSSTYNDKAEQVMSTKDIFKTILTNRFLWYIAFANAFVYMVRYGCLDWAPTILTEQGINIKDAGWAYFAYEMAAIPGTIICGWLSDRVFHGRRALPTMLFMGIVAVLIFIYWQNFNNIHIVIACLIAIGFFIYGPVMLIGVQALDLAPKNAAGTAAGLTGFLGYVLGTALLANVVIGYVAEKAGWNWTFVLLIGACVLSMLFMA